MNTQIDEESIAATDARILQHDQPCCSRTNALLFALGAGLAIGLIVRAFRPAPTASQRVAYLLADLEDRLRAVSGPARRRASALASDGADVLRDSLHDGEARLGGLFQNATRSVRKLFS